MVQLTPITGLGMVPGTKEEIESMESKLLQLPQVKCQLRTFHAPGVYLREITMPKGALIIGHEHLTEHFNIVAQGAALVVVGEYVERMIAPYTFVSGPGIRKVLLILDDMVWYTVHANPSNIRDEELLEEKHVVKSPTFLRKQLQEKAEPILKRLEGLYS